MQNVEINDNYYYNNKKTQEEKNNLTSLSNNTPNNNNNDTMSIQYFFNRIDSKFFTNLSCTFWSSDQTISRNFHFKSKYLSQSIRNCTNEQDIKLYKSQKDKIEQSHKALFNMKSKMAYLRFLFLNYVFSQPNSLEKLKNNFQFYVFPFFIFLINPIGKASIIDNIRNSNSIFNDITNVNVGSTTNNTNCISKATYIVIDFVRLLVNFYRKEKLEKGINAECIKEVSCEKERINIKIIDGEVNFSFESQIQQQRELIYVLLKLLMKKGKTANENENYINDSEDLLVEINNFKFSDLRLLKNESYMPTGIILKSFIQKENKKMYGSKLRYMVLGNSNIIIFKDEKMAQITNVIPIMHCNILFHFEEENLKMKIKLAHREYVIYFNSIDEFEIWKSTIYDLAECRIDEKIEEGILTSFIENNEDGESCEYKDFIFYLTNKIETTEEVLKDLKNKKESLIKSGSEKRNSINELMDKDNFEDLQKNYIQNKLKRLNSNTKNSNNSNSKSNDDLDHTNLEASNVFAVKKNSANKEK